MSEGMLAGDAQRLRDIISDDSQRAFGELARFAERYAATDDLKHEALLMRFTCEEAAGEPAAASAQETMLSLLERIERDHEQHWDGERLEQRQRSLDALRNRYVGEGAARPPVCVAKGLGKSYGREQFSLTGVDLELRAGEVTGLVGQNANGKTTLLRIVAGELRADTGSLDYPALSEGARDWHRIKSQIAYLPQELPAWQGQLADNLHFDAALHGLLGADNEREVRFFIERFGLGAHVGKKWSALSGGTKLRFWLTRVLVWKPKLLILDEPLANLDVNAQGQLLQILLDLARSRRYPQAILMSSQHLNEVEAVASTMIFLRNGSVVFNGPRTSLGRDSDTRVYELGTSTDLSTVTELFDHPVHGPPVHNGVSIVIKTDDDVDAQSVLDTLRHGGVDVGYFRDISHSVRRLFE